MIRVRIIVEGRSEGLTDSAHFFRDVDTTRNWSIPISELNKEQAHDIATAAFNDVLHSLDVLPK